MPRATIYPRYIEQRLAEALEDSPVVLIHGPRQAGKTTLAQFACAPDNLDWGDDAHIWESLPLRTLSVRERNYEYITFDDDTVRAGAMEDPVGFVGDLPERVILDEVQRAPEIFTAIKMAVDRNRVNGRFLLTGSSNVLLIPTLAESLAGRMEIVRLHPLSQDEIEAGLLWPGPPALTMDPRSGFLTLSSVPISRFAVLSVQSERICASALSEADFHPPSPGPAAPDARHGTKTTPTLTYSETCATWRASEDWIPCPNFSERRLR